MSIGGLLGKVRVENISPEMMAILKLGTYIHCGKQCTFGNGEIELKKCHI
jgi:CRISPR/Cas system endoribonuclease Cas6 (RAMP superfamily)